MPHEPANLNLDLALIGEAFVVVVVGGMGSIPRRLRRRDADRRWSRRSASPPARSTCSASPFPFSQADAGRRVPGDGGRAGRRPWGLFGKPQARGARPGRRIEAPLRPLPARLAPGRLRPRWLALALVAFARRRRRPTRSVLMIDLLIAVAVRRQPALHHGPGRHALVRPRRLLRPRRLRRGALRQGARPADGGVARCSRRWSPPLGAFVFGWFCVRLSGVYLAMLTLAFAQIVWSVVFQWDALHRRQQRPGRHLAGARGWRPSRRLLPAGAGLHGRRRAACCVRMLHAPFG